MEQKDYYQDLGVQKSATAKEIKEAYRSLALKYHPDRNADSKVSADRMKGVNEAYAVLSDPDKRREYDLLRDQLGASARGQFRQTYSDQDIFSGSDVQQIFEEVARSFGLRGFDEIFKDINGTGREGGGPFRFTHQRFGGGGFVFQGRFGRAGQRFGRPQGTRPGRGSGHRGPFGQHDPLAGGVGPARLIELVRRAIGQVRPARDGRHRHDTISLTPEHARQGGPYAYLAPHSKKKLVVKIPPNVRGGQTIRLAGMGQAGGNGGRDGDLYLRVQIKTPLLERIKRALGRLIKG